MKSGPSSQNRWKIEKKGNFYSDKFLRPLTTSFNLTKILVIERFPLFDFIISLLLKNRKSAQNKKTGLKGLGLIVGKHKSWTPKEAKNQLKPHNKDIQRPQISH